MTTSELIGDRSRASTDLTCDLAVTAGAGAGKTTVLVDRFVAIARDPALGPDRILAITFTRKAAAEMKERIIRIFEGSEEMALRRATESSYISTIHGFSERILREHPFDARVDPAFTVLSDSERQLWLQEATQAMYEREDLRVFAPRLKKQFKGEWRIFSLVSEVAQLIREGPKSARLEVDLIEDDDRIVELAMDRLRGRVGESQREMLRLLAELLPLLETARFTSTGKMRALGSAYAATARECVSCDRVGGAIEIWENLRFTGQIHEDEREPIRKLLDPIKKLAPVACFDDWQTQERHERELLPLKRAIYRAAAAIDRSYAEHKRELGVLDFHDLQLRAAELLEGNANVRAQYAERFRHILLDESQDTDELQYRIIESLRTPTNTLFMVGDPKQAIYEFRGANPDLFQNATEKLPLDNRLQLAENFRSRAEIVSVINGLGGQLLPGQFVPIDGRADYQATRLSAPAVTVVYAEQLALAEEGKKFEGVSAARPREAAAVAEELARLLREGTEVRDPETREVKWTPLRPKHIGVLFRTRTAIPYFEKALADRGIPYVTASGQGFYDRAEVLDCLMMLRIIAQPLDDLALAAVLRSPFVGASDADLWRLRVPAGERIPPRLWIALKQYPELTDFYSVFTELRVRSRGLSASEALDDAITTFGYEAALAAHHDGPAMLSNVAKVRRQLRSMGSATPLEAYHELQRSRELLPKESIAPLVGTADDVVVLTTIHQAKGLEWPVVCLPNLQSPPKSDASLFSARHGVLLCKPEVDGEAVQLMSLDSISAEIKARAEGEERRLLYVALTRARERLILSACVKEKTGEEKEKAWSPKSFNALTFLEAHSGEMLSTKGEHDAGAFHTRVSLVRELGPITKFNGERPLAESWTPEPDGAPEAVPVALAALPLSLKVTELLDYRRCPQVYRFSQVLEVKEHLQRRAAIRGGVSSDLHVVTPVELGTIVHALLERFRFDAADTTSEIARSVSEQPEGLRPKLTEMLKGVIDGELGIAIRNATRVERELRFATRIGAVLVEGVIDLAIQAADGRWSIVDYKSNDISRSGRYEYLTDFYTPQLDLYAMALTRAGIGTVSDCQLVFLSGPKIHRWVFDAASNAIESWSEQMVAQIAARDFATVAGPKCEHCGYRMQKICEVGKSWSSHNMQMIDTQSVMRH